MTKLELVEVGERSKEENMEMIIEEPDEKETYTNARGLQNICPLAKPGLFVGWGEPVCIGASNKEVFEKYCVDNCQNCLAYQIGVVITDKEVFYNFLIMMEEIQR